MANLAIQAAIGIGGFLIQALLAPDPKDIIGPRASDINVASVSPGNPISRVWGTMKVPAHILWISDLREIENREEVGGKGLGKKQEQVTYTYEIDGAFGVCEGPIKRIRYIRANQKLIWVNDEVRDSLEQDFDEAFISETSRLLDLGVDPEDAHVSGFFFAFNYYSLEEYTLGTEADALTYIMAHPVNGSELDEADVAQLLAMMLSTLNQDAEYPRTKKRFNGITIYNGTEEQMPDPLIESHEELGNVPAHRGLAYFVIDTLQLEDFGNTVPTFQVEVERHDGSVLLTRILADVCKSAGMDISEYRTGCDMPTIPVNGFAVTRNASARDVIGDLQKVYPFDGCESEYRLRFKWMESRPVAIFRREDFGAHTLDEDLPPSKETRRAHDYDLPRRINLTYQEPERNYSTNTVHAQRYLTEANMVEDVNVAISLNRHDAKKWVEKQFAHRFMERNSHELRMPSKYAIMDPGDVVLVEDDHFPGKFKAYRLNKVEIGASKLVNISMRDYHFYQEFTRPQDIVTRDMDEIPIGSATYGLLYDVPLLTDTEADNVGFYAIVAGARNGWSGGVLVVDIASGGVVEAYGEAQQTGDGGANWYTIASNSAAVLNGFVLNRLGPGSTLVRDWDNHALVSFTERAAVLYSYDEDTLQSNPYNMMFIGNELIQYAQAEDLGNGLWKLTGLMRGMRGTDHWVSRHAKGARAVKVRREALKRVEHPLELLNTPQTFRAYTIGGEPEDVQSFTFTNTGNSQRPWSPASRTVRMVGADWLVEWLPRARRNGGLKSGQTVTVDQPYERYQIDVLDGAEVVRTLELEDVRSWSYTAAMQTADFGSAQDSLSVNVYQIGEIHGATGRGFPLELRL